MSTADDLEALDVAIAEARADVLAAAEGDDGVLAERARSLIDLQSLRDGLTARQQASRMQAFVRVHDALARLREMPSLEAMIARAPEAVCSACDFDRAVLYRIDGGDMVAESFYIRGDAEGA